MNFVDQDSSISEEKRKIKRIAFWSLEWKSSFMGENQMEKESMNFVACSVHIQSNDSRKWVQQISNTQQ